MTSLVPLPVRSATASVDVLVRLVIGLEGAVAVAHQDQDVAVGIADEEVELAVAGDVGDGQAVGFGGTA